MGTIVNVVQGSEAWHQFRMTHHGASEAAIMLGLSKKVKRSELIRMKATGIGKEFSDWVQKNVLDKGHEVEALARPIVERQIGEDLYPATYEDGELSASVDGITLDGEFVFEHKQWSIELSESVLDGGVPEEHLPQCQQILMVTGAKKLLFVVSDGTKDNMVSAEVLPDPAWFQRIKDGWPQFDKDVAAYVPTEAVEPAKAEPMEHLPAVSVRMDGALSVAGNLPSFFDALKSFVARIPSKPATDNDFATCEAACKALKKAEDALDAAENGALASITPVEEMRRMVADCRKLARETRLASEKLVERRKIEIKEQAVMTARRALDDHIAALQAELAPMRLLPVAADFAGSIKGLRSIASMQDALDTTLATAKIAADAQARVIRLNVANFKERAAGFEMLFADLSTLVHKPADDFVVLVDARISVHKAAEAEKARKAAEAEAARIAEAEAKARAEEAARFEAEQRRKDEEAAAQRAAALKAEQAAQEAVVKSQTPSAPVAQAQESMPAPVEPVYVPYSSEQPTLKLGQINERLGYTVTADLLARLGFVAHTDRQAKLFRESEFKAICAALARHTIAVSYSLTEVA